MTQYISDELEWNAFAALTASYNRFDGNLIINSDIIFTDQPTTIFLGKQAIVNGKCNTLTLSDTTNGGLFILPNDGDEATTIIKNIIIDASAASIVEIFGVLTSQSFLIYNDGSYNEQVGLITNVHISGGIVEGGTISGLLGNEFGDSNENNLSIISECSVSCTIRSGSGFGSDIYHTTFDSCFFNGSLATQFSNGFCISVIGGDILFKNCYSSCLEIPTNSSGFIFNVGSSSLEFNKSYVLSNLTGNSLSGGFVARTDEYIKFTNCYYVGNKLQNSNSIGGFIGEINSGTSVEIFNSYSTISSNTGALAGTISGGTNFDIYNCHINGAPTDYYSLNSGTFFNQDSLQDLPTYYGTATLPPMWFPSIWQTNIPTSYPILADFKNLLIWDDTYIIDTSTPGYSAALCANVVPCFAVNTIIKTNNGEKYIQDVKYNDIIDGFKVQTIYKSKLQDKFMVKISKNSIGVNKPNKNLFVTKNHSFKINNKIITANKLCKLKSKLVYKVPPISEYVYHIALQDNRYEFLNIHNLKAETLTPEFQLKHVTGL